MSGFAALMALSASQTKESQSSVQSALVERQRREQLKRKQQEEREKKEREQETQMRMKRLEEEKRQDDLKRKREEEQAAKDRERIRREEKERDHLLYGPPKKPKLNGSTSKWPSSDSNTRQEIRRQRVPSNSDDEGSGAMALTREEKRKLKEENEFRRSMAFGKKSHHAASRRAGGRLPGGAMDVTSAQRPNSGSPDPGQSIKARLTAAPNTLTKLNVVKRDTRTIDEIMQDRQKAKEAKVLDGEDAKDFNDWFGDSKKRIASRKAESLPAPSLPAAKASTSASPSSAARSSASSYFSAPVKKMVISKSSNSQFSKVPSKPGPSVKSKSSAGLQTTNSLSLKHTPKAATSRPGAVSRKRTRSLSLSESESDNSPPPKRRAVHQEPARNAYSDEIWKLFGKDRKTYVARDVLSDDEDMEADANALEREELQSARLAKREDEAAREDERRHEAEKRRRKKEKELRERRA